MSKLLVSSLLLLGAAFGHATCQLSTEPHPRGVVGLHLFYPDDRQSWLWADELHVPWLRIELRWDWIQPSEGMFDAGYADRVMRLAGMHQQKIMVLFNHAPAWARREPGDMPRRAATAISWMVSRYGQRVAAWEVFNEPNLPGYGWPDLGDARVSATVYARTLSAVGNAIRALDKKALVISAGLSPQNDPEAYARSVVRLTPSACYDAMGLHPYGQQGRFAAVQKNAATLLAQEHVPNKPVWHTEYGTNQDSERADLISALLLEKSVAPITFFFAERDFGGWITESYGLRKRDGAAKAGYNEFKLMNTPSHHATRR